MIIQGVEVSSMRSWLDFLSCNCEGVSDDYCMIIQGVEVSSMRSWLDFLGSQARSAQLLADKSSPLVASLKDAMNRYVDRVNM